MARLGVLDKATHHLATRGLTSTQRNQLTAIQCLGIWDGAKQLRFYKEGDGRCAWCGNASTGLVHEVWACKALRDTQRAADADLANLGEHNTPMHILLGAPSQLIADNEADFFMPLENKHIPDGAEGLLKFTDTMGSEGLNLLQRLGGFPGATANTVAYKITCRVEAPQLLDIAPCTDPVPVKPNY